MRFYRNESLTDDPRVQSRPNASPKIFPLDRCLLPIVIKGLSILTLLLCLLVIFSTGACGEISPESGLHSAPGWALSSPEKRIGGSAVASSTFASRSASQVAQPHQENPACAYDFASGVHKYLYCHDNPVNGTDPSGHENLPSLSVSMGIGFGIGAASTALANHALGRAQTVGSILQGAALGAVLGPLAVEYAWFGVAAGGVGVASSATMVWEVFNNPNSTYVQKVDASALLVASVSRRGVGPQQRLLLQWVGHFFID